MSELGVSNSFGVILLEIGIIIVITLFIAYLFKKIGIPAVMGILIGGILIGLNEGFKSFFLASSLESFRLLVTELAVGYIAYDIGNEIDFQIWKDRISKYSIIILGELSVPFIVVTGFFAIVFNTNLGIAMIIGAIAMTTSPVITSEILGDYHTSEELNQIVLFLVAFDSVISILVINMAVTIVTANTTSINLLEAIIITLIQKISISLITSTIGALFILFMLNRRNLEERSLLEWLLGVSLVIIGITLTLNGSVILSMLFFGIMLKTMESRHEILTEHILQIEILLVPVVLLFYIFMGLSIDVTFVLGSGFILIIFYFILRFVGELGGTYITTQKSNLPNNIKNNLHYFLITQGGIAIALAGLAYNQLILLNLQSDAVMVLSVVAIGVIISEFVGPLLLRFGIKQSQKSSKIETNN